jgi:hypothetical protein
VNRHPRLIRFPAESACNPRSEPTMYVLRCLTSYVDAEWAGTRLMGSRFGPDPQM